MHHCGGRYQIWCIELQRTVLSARGTSRIEKLFGERRNICVIGTTVTARADTINFNVTWPGDPYSYEVKKADSEQNFYVTTTSHYLSGFFFAQSQQIDDGSIISNQIGQHFYTKADTVSRRSVGTYARHADGNKYYQLVTSSSRIGMNVKGRYTP